MTLVLAVPGFVLQVMKLLRLQDNGALTANVHFDGAVMIAVWAIIIVWTLAAARASAKQAIGLEPRPQSGTPASGLRSICEAGEIFAQGLRKRPVAASLVLVFCASIPIGLVLLAYGWDTFLARRDLWFAAGFAELAPLLVIVFTVRAVLRMRSR